MEKSDIKIESWRNYGDVVILRNSKGRLISWAKHREGIQIEGYFEVFKRNKTFSPKIKKLVDIRNKVVQISYVTPTKYNKFNEKKIPSSRLLHGNNIQYTITGYRGNKRIGTVTSYKINNPNQFEHGHSKQEAVDWARSKFHKNIDFKDNGGYDEKSGREIAKRKLTRIEEGWTVFRKKKKTEIY